MPYKKPNTRMAKKRKPPSLPSLKKKLDRIYSRYVRYSAVDSAGKVSCFTCEYRGDPKKMHAGHWIPRQHMAVRWESWNVHPQCYACNMHYGGRPQEYRERLVEIYGEVRTAEFAMRRHEIRQWTRDELGGLISNYEKKLKELEE